MTQQQKFHKTIDLRVHIHIYGDFQFMGVQCPQSPIFLWDFAIALKNRLHTGLFIEYLMDQG
jgi:hypothetical protein